MGNTHRDDAPLSPTELARIEARWSIALYRGRDPLSIAPPAGVEPVILRGAHATDITADFVADPFCHTVDGTHVLFFEVWNRSRHRGEIACATSADCLTWRYDSVVLREDVHLSYPCVFASGSDIFMIPETREAQAVRLFRAEAFPHRWRLVRELLRGDFADATPFRYQDRWWLFVHRGLDELRLFSAAGLDDRFEEHPASPLVAGNRRVSRPAGRLLTHNGRVLRFAQDAWPNYGSRVRALEINELSVTTYAEHEIPESPILEGTGPGWNALGMHHIEHLPPDGTWLALVDGYAPAADR